MAMTLDSAVDEYPFQGVRERLMTPPLNPTFGPLQQPCNAAP